MSRLRRDLAPMGVSELQELLVPPADAAALPDSIEALMLQPELRRAIGRPRRSLVRSEFSEAQIIEESVAVYARDQDTTARAVGAARVSHRPLFDML